MIDVRDLSKRFGRLDVLRGVSTAFPAGSVTSVVGPNASGKSTLMKAILGLVRPDAGTITIDGRDALGDPGLRSAIGYMPQEPRFPDNLRPAELFAFVQDLRGERAPALAELVAYFELGDHLGKPLRTLSGGTRQKVSAVLAFLFEPRILILDEPTAGLDPVASARLKDRVQAERERGTAVVLTSHVMSELEELTDEVVFLLEGSVRFRGSLEDIRVRTGEDRLERALAHLMAREAGHPDLPNPRLAFGGAA